MATCQGTCEKNRVDHVCRVYVCRAGKSQMYTVYMHFFGRKTTQYQIYGHIRCIYAVLANPVHTLFLAVKSPNIRSYTVLANGHIIMLYRIIDQS
jgi:hypothetical protein